MINKVEFNKEDLNNVLKEFSKQQSLKFPVLMKFLRSALSGLKVSELYLWLGAKKANVNILLF